MAKVRKQILFSVRASAVYPTYLDTIAVGFWQAVNLNLLSDVDAEKDPAANPNYPGTAPWHQVQGQAALTNAWNGGCLASGYGQFGSLCFYGGGHNAYAGSEIYAFDIATRLWKRVTNPYPGPFNFPYSNGLYPDGSPVPPHTYDSLSYHPGTNRFVKLRSVSESSSASSNPLIVGYAQTFDFDTNIWTNTNVGARLLSSGFSCYDSLRQVCWAGGGSSTTEFYQFNPSTLAFTVYPSKFQMTDSVAAYDPINDTFVVTGFRNGTDIHAWKLSGDVAANPKKILSQAGTIPNRQSSHGWEWSPFHQGFVYYRRDGLVYLLKNTSGAWDTGTWTWSLLTNPGNTVIPPDESTGNGLYSRCQLISYNNGQREALVTCSGRTLGTYMFRLH